MKATEGYAVVAVAIVGWVDIGVIEGEAERESGRAPVPSPVAATTAGVVQGAIRTDIAATDKEES